MPLSNAFIQTDFQFANVTFFEWNRRGSSEARSESV